MSYTSKTIVTWNLYEFKGFIFLIGKKMKGRNKLFLFSFFLFSHSVSLGNHKLQRRKYINGTPSVYTI